MSFTRESLEFWVIDIIADSFRPHRVGIRRRDILKQILVKNNLFYEAPSDTEKTALNMRLQRVLNSLVKEGSIKKKKNGDYKVFYLLEEEAFIEWLDEGGVLKDREEFEKYLKQAIINRSEYLKLPEYFQMLPTMNLHEEDMGYDEFRSNILDISLEILEPQIIEQWEFMKKTNAQTRDQLQISVASRGASV